GIIAGKGGELGDPPVRDRETLLAQSSTESGIC
ncbi:MAG: hypothetical protein QOE54_6632, partial [Streptosporangiaceae bacterium]|nr:hypothetical protein [Streptosporangiaceae bacterium]